jgi:pilus assembly protein CpaC
VKKLLILLSVIALCASSLQDAQARSRRKPVKTEFMNLYVGLSEDKKFPNLPDRPIYKGNYKKFLKLSHSIPTRTLRFDPVKPGTATLTVHDGKSKNIKVREIVITIRQGKLSKVASEIQNLLKEIEGIKVKILNDKVVVDGQVLLPSDFNRIIAVISQYGDQASSIVSLSPIASKKFAELIERDINNPEIHCRAVNNKFILEGVARDENEKARAEIIAKTYVPDIVNQDAVQAGKLKEIQSLKVINLLSLKPSPAPRAKKIIQLVVHYVELKKGYERGFRFQWTPGISDGTKINFATGSREPGGVVSSITGTVSNLLPKLNWAKQHGHARVLKSSSIIVQDGKKGVLSAETRIPYLVMGDKGQQQTNFEGVGISTSIQPTTVSARSDSIQLDIKFKIKALLGMTSKGPVTSSNIINTYVVVRNGMSAAIGGLVSNSSGTDYNKLNPDNVSNPLISLLSSKSFRRNQSQFVVFITPIIKSSASAGADKIKAKFRLRE